jgi:cell division septation protein DedD
LFVAFAVILFLILSPGTSGRSNNPCSSGPGCHGSLYYQYLDILEGDIASQIPSAIEVEETKTVSVVVENSGNPGEYSMLSGVSVTLTSKNGHFSVDSPTTYNIGDLPLGKKTATFQITGISEGFDSLSITSRGDNKQHLVLVFSFSDSYSASITVGHPPPTPTPAPTPTPTPTPSPTTNPTTPTPTPSSPTQTPTPDTASTPAPTNQLSIQLTSPADGEQWAAGTIQSIEWSANGGTGPLIITLEYSTSSANGPWTTIATGISNNGSLTWTPPNSAGVVYVRVSVTDSANPPTTALTIGSAEISEANPDFPLIIIPAVLLPAIALLTVLFKRKKAKTVSKPELAKVKAFLKWLRNEQP